MGTPPSKFIDIVARESGIYSALDLNRGRVFTYDSDGHLLYVFGARGYQAGAAVKPSAIEEINGNLLVLDAITNTVTVYKPTEYAAAIHRALGFTNRRHAIPTACGARYCVSMPTTTERTQV